MHANHVHFFFGKDFGDVAQQALPVRGFNRHVNGVNRALHLAIGTDTRAASAPLHLNHAFAIFGDHFAQVGAIGPVHAHTFAACDKTADGIGWCGFAALGQLRHERINAHHQQAAFGRWVLIFGLAQEWRIVLGCDRFRWAKQQLDIAQRELVLADHFKQIIG